MVQSHPVEDSYNAALLAAVVEQLPQARVVRVSQGERLTAYACIDVTQLVAIYPTWWGSVPAELLHALNDLVGPWVDGDESKATSPLRSVKSLTVITTHGSPKHVNMLQGEPGLQLWKRTILPLCARRARFSWQSFYGMDQRSDTERAAFLAGLSVSA